MEALKAHSDQDLGDVKQSIALSLLGPLFIQQEKTILQRLTQTCDPH